MHAELGRRSQETGVSWANAGFSIAYDEVKAHPFRFFHRAVNRLRMLWSVNHFALRHLYRTVYPPVSLPFAPFITLFISVSYLFLFVFSMTGAIDGMRSNQHIRLLIILVIAGMVPVSMTIGMSRLHLPLLALLLPAAGHGLSVFFSGEGRRLRVLVCLVAIVSVWHVWSTFPLVLKNHLHPSTYYGPVVLAMDKVFGTKTEFSDRILVQCNGGCQRALKVSITSADGKFPDGRREKTIKATSANPVVELKILSKGKGSLVVTVEDLESTQTVSFQPIQRTAWMSWQVTGIPDLSWKWSPAGN